MRSTKTVGLLGVAALLLTLIATSAPAGGTSSYIVGVCSVYLAEHADGGGWWYPGPTYPYAGEPSMQWDWHDTISTIYIY